MVNGKRRLVLVAHNLRSAHNVGSLLRTAEGLGVERVILSGYTPYPPQTADQRLPHIAQRVGRQISKTALGAEASINWRQTDDLAAELERLRADGYELAALEQTPAAIDLKTYQPPAKLGLVVGNEVTGLEPDILATIPIHLQIPMQGAKESFNVSVAAAMALYHLINA